MDRLTLDQKLERISACAAAANVDSLFRNLLHAYTACLTTDELCDAVVHTFDSSRDVRRAILVRLLRIGKDGGRQNCLDEICIRLLGLSSVGYKAQVRVDAMLSALYKFFSLPTRRVVLEQWRGRGTLSAGSRWLKAIFDDEQLFSIDEILAYWRTTDSPEAAKLLVYRSDAMLLAELMPELIEGCDDGRIISRAVLSAETISEASWSAIRDKFPATYAYVCAKLNRKLKDAEALSLVREAGKTWPADDRGLVIWALGQLGMWSVLDQIRAMSVEFRKEAFAGLLQSA